MHDGILLTGDILRGKWKEFADLVGIPQDERLELSSGWLDKFKKRNGLKMHKRHGEAVSSSPIAIENEHKRIQEIIDRLMKQGYKLQDIFNMDETGLFYVMTPDRGLADCKHAGVKGNKIRVTYALTTNADGSEKHPTFIIGKAFKPRDFEVLYQDWIQRWDQKLKQKGQKIVLLQDNASGHIVPEGLECIEVINFKPNLTPHVQLMDMGII
ncbi:major centromere autoantigen b [Moniliophthora roreri MCA 2997]|uniref:Major centromere autoantigen b n=1 Tax=Moniliophthora roreri (strain MCA 2997) TaxID=1381753 RepID=V2WPU3_MONRO|nr:major centromere autoantigen b [Moniliophthora roreri MCA 2997]